MQLYSSTLKGPLKVVGYVDPDDAEIIQIFWGAPVLVANTVYRKGNIIRPATDNGFYYECTLNGVSNASTPTWQSEDDTTVGTAIFKPIPYDLWVLPDQSLIASTWEVAQVNINDSWQESNGHVTITGNDFGVVSSYVYVTATSAAIKEFDLTNQVTKNNNEKLSFQPLKDKVA